MDRARRSSLRDSTGRTPGFEGWIDACAEIEADLPSRSESVDRLRQTIEAELDALQTALAAERERTIAAEQALEQERSRSHGHDGDLEAERKRLREELDRCRQAFREAFDEEPPRRLEKMVEDMVGGTK